MILIHSLHFIFIVYTIKECSTQAVRRVMSCWVLDLTVTTYCAVLTSSLPESDLVFLASFSMYSTSLLLVSVALSQPVSLSTTSLDRYQHHIQPSSLTNINDRERFLPLINPTMCCQNGASDWDNPGCAKNIGAYERDETFVSGLWESRYDSQKMKDRSRDRCSKRYLSAADR